MADFTTTSLLASIKRQGMLSSTDGTLDSDDFLAIATEQLQSYMMELLLSVREEYCVAYTDYTVTPSLSTFAIPARAIGGKLEDVKVSTDGGTTFFPLTRVEPHYAQTWGQGSGNFSGYRFEGNSIILVPTPAPSGTLRLVYFQRPNALVLPAATATISAINVGRTVITTSATIPSTFTSSRTYDVIGSSPGFTTLVADASASGTVSGTTITLATALPSTVAVGDYVALAGESPVPQIPVELHPLLVQRVVVKALEALGDNRVSIAKAMCDEARAMALTLLTPRSENSSRPIVQRFGAGNGALSRGFRRRRF